MTLPKYVPTPEEAVQKLSRVSPHLQPAFEDAIFQAVNYMETKKLEYDVNSLYMMIRLHVKNYLLKLGIEGVKFDNYSLEGLSLEEADAHWRIWKAESHELPPPGNSGARQDYYNQQYSLPFDGQEVGKLNKFAILWNLGPKNKVTLWLVCPKFYDDETKKSDSWWFRQIPEPTLGISVGTEIGTPPSDLQMEAKPKQKKNVNKG